MKRLHALMAIGAAPLLGAATVGPVASAANSPNLCDTNRVCILDDLNWDKLMGERTGGGGWVNVTSATSHDQMSSWSNKTSSRSAWAYDANGMGTCRNMAPKTNNSWVRGDSDQMDSWKTNGYC